MHVPDPTPDNHIETTFEPDGSGGTVMTMRMTLPDAETRRQMLAMGWNMAWKPDTSGSRTRFWRFGFEGRLGSGFPGLIRRGGRGLAHPGLDDT